VLFRSADELAQVLGIKESDLIKQAKQETPEGEIQRLQGLWIGAAKGDVTALNTVHDEVAQDIARVTDEIAQHRNAAEPLNQEDVDRYDTSVAELSEWQATLQETPVDVNSRLGRQINRTVAYFIKKRDGTFMGKLNKQLRQLERVEKDVSALTTVPTAK